VTITTGLAEPQTSTRGRGYRPRDSSQLDVRCVTRLDEIAALEPEWRTLHDVGASLNPYASPDWVIPWLAHFTDETERAVLTVRRSEQLIGVAPCYIRRLPGGIARTVQLAGTIRGAGLTELPQVLAAPNETRSVQRAVLAYWGERAETWDWLELPLSADQGWFEPQWLGEGAGFRGLVQHKMTRAAVVLPLDGAQPPISGLLKRNVWESVKRSRNRLNRECESWHITVHEGADAAAALPILRRLHAARATTAGKRTHPDALAVPAHYAFFEEAVRRMAVAGCAELMTLDVADEPIAALLVLRAAKSSYFALSGLDPAWWRTGPVTLLQYEAAENAARRADAEVNFSVGPDLSKLRWSEHVVQHPEFVVCGPRPRSRRRLAGYAALASMAALRREAARHRVLGDNGKTSGEH
jgi:CelD/BcsL family acetyltransferase involved in cellulose biosynthesis